MKYFYLLLTFSLLLPQISLADTDSVYSWGAWQSGIKPAAGPAARVTPPPAQQPDISFRPNENSAFLREAAPTVRPAPPAVASAPQVPNVVITTSSTPTTPRDQF